MKKPNLKIKRTSKVRDLSDSPGARNELALLKKRADEYLAGWQRAKADYKNLVARNDEQQKQLTKIATKDLILEILPVVDNIERALEVADNNKSDKKTRDEKVSEDTKLREGFTLILKQLQAILAARGVKKINCVGKPFNPAIHEAIAQVKGPAGVCIAEHTTGYEIGDTILRPSRVSVGS